MERQKKTHMVHGPTVLAQRSVYMVMFSVAHRTSLT